MANEKPRLEEGPDVVICTPTRLAAHLDAGNVSLCRVEHVVVDEAVSSFLVSLGQSVGIVIAALMLTMGWRAGLVVGATLGATVGGRVSKHLMFTVTILLG